MGSTQTTAVLAGLGLHLIAGQAWNRARLGTYFIAYRAMRAFRMESDDLGLDYAKFHAALEHELPLGCMGVEPLDAQTEGSQ